jgi:hypothetical protein
MTKAAENRFPRCFNMYDVNTIFPARRGAAKIMNELSLIPLIFLGVNSRISLVPFPSTTPFVFFFSAIFYFKMYLLNTTRILIIL